MNNNEYRLMPVALLPAIRDALVETGKCFQPATTWTAIIEAFDRVAAPERSETPADEQPEAWIVKLHDGRRVGTVFSEQAAIDTAASYGNASTITRLYTRSAPTVSSSAAPIDGWEAYARKSGLLNENGVAIDRAKTQTAYFAYTAALAAPFPTGESLSAAALHAIRNLKECRAGTAPFPSAAIEILERALAAPSVQGVAAAGQDKPTAEKAGGLCHTKTWQHAANEWADTAYNGLQHLRNIEDLLTAGRPSGVRAARENMERCCEHAKQVADAVPRDDSPTAADAGGLSPLDGWNAAAKALAERAAGHFRMRNFTLQDECLQCASMLHDMKPARPTAVMAGDLRREARNKVCIDGHLNAALDDVMRSNSPDGKFNLLGALAGKAIDIALDLAEHRPPAMGAGSLIVPHEMGYSKAGNHIATAYANGWNDCRATMLGEIPDDPTSDPVASAAGQKDGAA